MGKPKVLRISLGLVFLLCATSGIFLFALSPIPFGSLFDVTMYVFALTLAATFWLIALLLFRSPRHWLKWVGVVPVLLGVTVFLAGLAITIDLRILHFRGLPPTPTTAQWKEDLHYLADQMTSRHEDLFALVSREEWESMIKEIEDRLPSLPDHAIVMELFRVVSLPNDNHSFPFIMSPCFDLHSFPFQVYGFPEGWHIVAAGRGYEDLVGARVVKIGEVDVQEIYRRYPLLLSAENESARKDRFPYMLLLSEWLAYHRIITDIGKADFTFSLSSGEQVVREVRVVRFFPHFIWSNAIAVDNTSPPVFRNPHRDWYWYEYQENSRTLYVRFTQCVNQPGKETIDEFAARLGQMISANPVDRCILDLRYNDGGDRVYERLLQVFRDTNTINQRRGLFVLLGRRTHSAAVMFATELQMQTEAIFVGEPTAQGPYFYSGPRVITLPNSRLEFAISSHLTVAGLPFDRRSALTPDVPVEYTYHDFSLRADPVLKAALSDDAPPRLTVPLSEQSFDGFVGRYLLDSTLIVDVTRVGTEKRTEISDFVPFSGARLASRLYPTSPLSLETHLPGVSIRRHIQSSATSKELVLDWMGLEKPLKQAPKGFSSAFELISSGNVSAGCEALLLERDRYRQLYPNLEGILNRWGYMHLRRDSLQAALRILKMNVELFPESSNVYDSYGEALMVSGQIDLALQNYRTSLELNPENENAKGVIERLTAQ